MSDFKNNNNFSFNGDNNKNERNKNKITDNSVNKNKEINNNKIISKDKNAKKKIEKEIPENTENSLSLYFDIELKENTNQSPSYNRPNIEKLFNSSNSVEMIAYVQGKRKDGNYVLYNVCTDTQFMADHVIVESDPERLIESYIGYCVSFIASAKNYKDKYGLIVHDIKDLNVNKPYKFICGDISLTNDTMVKEVFNYLYKEITGDTLFRIVDKLTTIIENYSASIFGSKKFLMGMIFNILFLGSENHNLSYEYDKVLDRSKEILVLILSDILYMIEKYRNHYEMMIINIDDEEEIDNDQLFCVLHKRMIKIALLFQRPIFDLGRNKGYGVVFNDFCRKHDIKLNQGEYFIRDNYTRFNLKSINNSINLKELAKEIQYEVSVVVPSVLKHM